jgi:hypothetical protein
MKPDYSKFDAALLDLIANRVNTMTQLDSKSSGLRELAEPFARASNNPTFRIVDRRLQALRKRGDLRFNGRYWVRLVDGRPV